MVNEVAKEIRLWFGEIAIVALGPTIHSTYTQFDEYTPPIVDVHLTSV